MPLYEEKLISPLAIRFTQQRIRETFRDGNEVEATRKQITVKPGAGDYDIILEAPFPAIEIIRWTANGRSTGEEHWFSFDNRRLYCLQRVAAEYWPKRVAVTVEVLYADSSATSIRKKLDSQTGGLSVQIGHAFATPAQLKGWDWRKACNCRKGRAWEDFVLAAKAGIAADDAKATVSDLMNAPVAPSSFERLSLDFEAQGRSIQFKEYEASEPSENSEKQEQVVTTVETLSPEATNLSNMIAQLLAGGASAKQQDGQPAEGISQSEEDSDSKEELSQSEAKLVTEDLTKTGDEEIPDEALQPAENSLTSLLGQLFELQTVQPTVFSSESEGARGQAKECTPRSHVDATDLDLKTKERTPSCDSDDTHSTRDPVESSSGSAASSQSRSPSGSDKEEKVEQQFEPRDSSPQQALELSEDLTKEEDQARKDRWKAEKSQEKAKKRAEKNAKAALGRAQFERTQSHIVQSHMAQRYQMAQWEMAQWHQQAQMAQWQQAQNFAFQAECQAAQEAALW